MNFSWINEYMDGTFCIFQNFLSRICMGLYLKMSHISNTSHRGGKYRSDRRPFHTSCPQLTNLNLYVTEVLGIGICLLFIALQKAQRWLTTAYKYGLHFTWGRTQIFLYKKERVTHEQLVSGHGAILKSQKGLLSYLLPAWRQFRNWLEVETITVLYISGPINSRLNKESEEWIPLQNCQKTDVGSIIVKCPFLIQFIELAFVEYLFHLSVGSGNGLKWNQNLLFSGKINEMNPHSQDYPVKFCRYYLLVCSTKI